ncbi:cation transporter [Pistricoccus aurantiacus]|uniref:Cation transporter n=1 Tax=Pistricoccus aurantiacus TaxID=1883414 RepID=A0A5B8SRM9_9GAMM|nr:Na+/H+ antiporter subunit E [Pistricoccus aurantiacus]QEA39326.1 cation transporter [Pistricoccus aurantiacus]
MRTLQLLSLSVKGLLLGIVWWSLTDGSVVSWSMGIPVILIALGWMFQQQRPSPLPSLWLLGYPLTGLAGFLPYFLRESLRGGIDVARLALSPVMRIDPRFSTYSLHLPEGPARRTFINTVSLLPGTLSADLSDGQLIVHRLRPGPANDTDLQECERRVARLFGMTACMTQAKDGPVP